MAMGMAWDFYQEGRIAQADQTAQGARRRASQAEREVAYLRAKVDRLALGCQAMWELLRDHSDFEEEHLLAKMQEIDLRDGREDGRMQAQVLTCGQCGRKSSSRRARCIYCGEALGKQHAFE